MLARRLEQFGLVYAKRLFKYLYLRRIPSDSSLKKTTDVCQRTFFGLKPADSGLSGHYMDVGRSKSKVHLNFRSLFV